MTHFTIACPRDDLRGLIDGAVSGEMQQAIQTHLESCARCQQALASLVVVSESWTQNWGNWVSRRVSPLNRFCPMPCSR